VLHRPPEPDPLSGPTGQAARLDRPAVQYAEPVSCPADHGPAKASWRRTFHGLARTIVGSAEPGATGTIIVTAVANGLRSAQVEIEAK